MCVFRNLIWVYYGICHFEICHIYCSYKKSRGLMRTTAPSIGIVVKFLPIPLAVIIATIVIRVKPVEANFAKVETQVASHETLAYLYTEHGSPVDPFKMAETLSSTWHEVGMEIKLSDLRHALEAFAHKLQPLVPRPSFLQEIYATQANHNTGSSAGYGRDENCFGGVSADVSEQNSAACNVWNICILKSPSVITEDRLTMLQQQLQNFGMLGDGDMSVMAEICGSCRGSTLSSLPIVPSNTGLIAAQEQPQPCSTSLDRIQQVFRVWVLKYGTMYVSFCIRYEACQALGWRAGQPVVRPVYQVHPCPHHSHGKVSVDQAQNWYNTLDGL